MHLLRLGIPHQREEIAAEAATRRLHQTEAGVRGDGRIDGRAARGEAIRPVDLRTERKARAELPAGAVTDVATLTAKVTRMALAAGAMMRDGDLVKQDIVEKNSIVTVVYEGPGLSLSMRGKAMEAGGMGDAILIQNIQSKRSVQGTVVGPGKVSVNFGVPGPVAAVQSTLE